MRIQVAARHCDIPDSVRKRTEEQLRASEDKFRLIAQLAPAGIYMTDTQGRCVYANERWCEMAGLGEEEALGEGRPGPGVDPDAEPGEELREPDDVPDDTPPVKRAAPATAPPRPRNARRRSSHRAGIPRPAARAGPWA